MFFHVRIFLYSLVFFGILELVSMDFVSSQLAMLTENKFFLILFMFVAVVFYFYQISKKISRSPSMTPIPTLFVVGSLGLLYFIENHWQQNVFILICAFIYYFLHIALYRLQLYRKDKTAIGIISAGNVAAVFLMYAVAYGIYLNFAISLWFFMAFIFLVTMFLGFQYFWLINENKRIVLNYSLILGFVMAEIVWVLNFWPFGYLTTSVVGLIFYFVFWDIIQRHFLQKLSKRRIVANMVFLGVIVTIVLSSTRWFPAI